MGVSLVRLREERTLSFETNSEASLVPDSQRMDLETYSSGTVLILPAFWDRVWLCTLGDFVRQDIVEANDRLWLVQDRVPRIRIRRHPSRRLALYQNVIGRVVLMLVARGEQEILVHAF